MPIHYIAIDNLRAHEKTNKKNLAHLKIQITACGYVKNPVVVDKNTGIILDGHHRTKALRELGYTKVPALLVDYRDKKITVSSRRKKIKVSKQIIVEKVLKNKIFPYKTSKHTIPHRLKNINTPLPRLK